MRLIHTLSDVRVSGLCLPCCVLSSLRTFREFAASGSAKFGQRGDFAYSVR